MADYTKIAFADIRNFLWNKLQSEEILDPDDYWVDKMGIKLNPIIPSQQIPEFQNLLPGQPYITYDIETIEYDTEFWITDEIATLTIVGDGYGKIYQIIEFIKDLFRRYDISAREVNASRSDSTFNFLKIYVTRIMSPDIGSESDGQTATVEISYCYTRQLTSGLRVQ